MPNGHGPHLKKVFKSVVGPYILIVFVIFPNVITQANFDNLRNLLSHYLGLLPKEINVAGNNPPLIRVLIRPDTQYIKALSCFCWGRIFLGNYDIITRVTKNGQGGFPISIRLESAQNNASFFDYLV